MKNFRIKIRLAFLLFLFIYFITSCNKNEELGLNIQPPEDIMGVNFIDTIPLIAYTVYEDSIRTDEVTYNLIGSCADPIFGLTNAGAYSQFKLTTTAVNFGNNPVCDSVVLSLAYQGFYGDTSTTLTLNVFEISDDMDIDKNYYSNDVLGVYKNNLANVSFKPNFKDSVQVGSTKYAPHLRVKLKNSLGQKFINASGSSDLADNTNFLKFFKGLYISTKQVSSGGAILYFNFLSSITKLSLYYHNDEDTAAYNFIIDATCARYNSFDHKNFSSADPLLKQQISGDTILGDSVLYVQAMAGTKIKIRFPDILGLNNLGKIAINKAELVLKVDENAIGAYAPPEKLILSKINPDGTLSFLTDYAYGDAYYGGSYSSTTKEYRFNIGQHVQDALLKGSFDDKGLYLVVSGGAVKSNRAVLKGNKTSQDNLRLEIIYTKID
ncbi:MAG TPA: DUF4270 domain-containing protein [Bacteroidales bacterium]|mgnify:CR=1 FL=1|nr:DUF4270 domain-containing protein [Bacteroidales bacterium]